jgi:phosphatidylserine/phosphatidylglycerophosphate/cardiolipin synthase-like enzyme
MRFRSKSTGGYRVYAVSGTDTVSFGIETAEDADTEGLLGFSVHREDHTENQEYYMYGFKVFPSVIPQPQPGAVISTQDHPIQSFVWDDFTAKPGHDYTYTFHPLKGQPKNLDRSARPIKIKVKTEKQFDDTEEHDIFFNRGVASSQAYVRQFGSRRPEAASMSPQMLARAEEWLSRRLDDGILAFIKKAKAGDHLRGCFYEFHYAPVLEAFQQAIDRGVHVQIIVDGKVNEHTDKEGKFHESFPREANLRAIDAAGIPLDAITLREANRNDIQHNKFLILLKGARQKPSAVFTGSTNLSRGGIMGQTNVGHWVRNEDLAERYLAYWSLLSGDPGAQAGDDTSKRRTDNAKFKKDVEELVEMPELWSDFAAGITPVFSPRKGTAVLNMYARMVDEAAGLACITLAFGISKFFKDLLKDNPPGSHLCYLLLEKQDKPREGTEFIAINSKQNVYKAWGAYLRSPLYQWAREQSTLGLKLNKHVAYIHSKFLLADPLSDDPIVVTGSANFSEPSTNANDENMMVIRGNQRVADIYFSEFNRLFFHYYFRSVVERTSELQAAGRLPVEAGNSASPSSDTLFLKEDSSEWLDKYKPGGFKAKRVEVFTKMKGFTPD